MNRKWFLYLAVAIFWLFGFSHGFSQTWEELSNKTQEFENKGDLDSALIYAKSSLKKAEEEFGTRHINYVNSLNELALLYKATDNNTAAEPLYQKALEIIRLTLGTENADYATSLNNLALFYLSLDNFKAAEPLLKEALEIRRKVLGEEHPEVAQSINNLAGLYYQTGNYESTTLLLRQSLEINRKVLGEQDPEYALSLNNLAGLYLQMGRYLDSEPLFKQSLEIRRKVLGVENIDYAVSLNNLAQLYSAMGKYTEAEPLLRESLEIRKNILGEESRGFATALNNLALLYFSMGNFETCEPLFRRAMEIRGKVMGTEHSEYASSLNNLGMLYDRMGNYAAAEPMYSKALEVREKVFGREHAEYATSLNNLAAMYDAMGNCSAAEPLYEQALEIRKKVLGVEHAGYASSLNNLAGLLAPMGNYAAALPLYQQAVQVFRNAVGEAHPEYATSLNNLAALYKDMGNYDQAGPLFRQALETRRNSLGVDHPDYVQSLNNLASYYQFAGQPAEAEKWLLEANPHLVNQLFRGYGFMSEEEAQLYYESLGSRFEANNSFIAGRQKTSPQLAVLSLDNELALKGASLQAAIRMRQSVLESGDSVLIGTFRHWTGVKEQLNRLYNQPLSMRFADADSLGAVANRLEKELIHGSQAFGNIRSSLNIHWTDVQKELSEDQAAIEFINFRFNDGGKPSDSILYSALLIRPGYVYPKFVSLSGGKDIGNLLCYPDAPNGQLIAKRIDRDILRQLYKLAWEPMVDDLKGVRTVFLSPSGLLNRIPFQALMSDDSTCLIDSVDIRYLLSSRELAAGKSAETPPGSLTAALFGGVRYDLDTAFLLREAARGGVDPTRSFVPDDSTRNIISFKYLEGTRVEVEHVNDCLTGHGWETRMYTDSLATEGQFKRLIGKNAPGILHVATHGFYFPQRNTSGKDPLKPGQDSRFRSADNPLRRTGLILAGGNLAWRGMPLPEGVEDGVLTAYEIANLDLRNTEMVVLSACETGLGDIRSGEGVYGLQRAFRLAGVKAIIMSLWPVDDKTTAELMGRYFQYWMNGEKQVTAFNHAVADLRGICRNEPEKWAAFVLVE